MTCGWQGHCEDAFVLPPLSDLGLESNPEAVTPAAEGTSPAADFPPSSAADPSFPPGSAMLLPKVYFYRVPEPTLLLERFEFDGNRAIADEQLDDLLSDFTGNDLDREDLERARVAVTQEYIDRGFINSGAVLPDQGVENGTVTLKIFEGELTDIHIEGNRWLRDRYLRNRIRLGAGIPLNINDLEIPLALLHRNPTIRKLDSELKPDAEPGKSYLQVTVEEERPLRDLPLLRKIPFLRDMPIYAGIDMHNRRPASVGEEQIELWLTDTSLTGSGDILELRYGLLDMGLEDPHVPGVSNYSIAYALPITRWDTTLHARYGRNSYSILEQPFADLDIEGETSLFRFGVRHPVIRKPDVELGLGLFFDRIESQTTLLDIPFSVTAGAVEGRTELSVLRFTQDYVHRGKDQVLALQSSINTGLGELGVFGVTDDGSERDNEFTSWLGQAQYVRKIAESDIQLILRGSLQLADDPLLSTEQFLIGGAYTVRGYRENQLVRDMGYLASLEVQIPVWHGRTDRTLLTVAPFVDYGGGWNAEFEGNFIDDDQHESITSAGFGLIFQPSERVSAQLYWGHAFTDFASDGDSLQDHGFHFQISIGGQ